MNRTFCIVLLTLLTVSIDTAEAQITDVTATMSSLLAEETSTTLTVGFTSGSAIVPGITISVILTGWSSGSGVLNASPFVMSTSGFGAVNLASAVWTSSTDTLVVTLGGSGSVASGTPVEFEVDVATNPVSGTSHPVRVTYNGVSGDAPGTLDFIGPVEDVVAGMSSYEGGAASTLLAIGFTDPLMLPVGATLSATIGSFGSAIATIPVVTRVSGFGTTTISAASYDQGTSILTITLGGSGGISAATPLVFEVAVDTNPVASSSHIVSIVTSASPVPANAGIAIVFSEIQNVTAMMSSIAGGEASTTMSIGFDTALNLPVGTVVTTTIGTFGAGINTNPVVSPVSGFGITSINNIMYDQGTSTLTFVTAGSLIAAGTTLVFDLAVDTNPAEDTSHLVTVKTNLSPVPVAAANTLDFFMTPVELLRFEID